MNRFARFALIALTTTALSGAARADEAFTAAQKAALKEIIHDYIVNNPEAVVESLNTYQSHAAEREQKAFTKTLPKYTEFLTSAETPSAGNPNGKKTVVEFFDYNCGYCKHAVDDIVNIIKADSDVKVYFKEMPILADSSQEAARYALAAARQNKYYDFHVALMKSAAPRKAETYEKIAKDIGADWEKMKTDAEDPQIKAEIGRSLEAARDLGIRGTPAFIIEDKLYPGYLGLDNMKRIISGNGSARDKEKKS